MLVFTWAVKRNRNLDSVNETFTNEMNGVSGHESALVSLYWAGDNLGSETFTANEQIFISGFIHHTASIN